MSDEIEFGQDVLEVKFAGLNIVQEVSLVKRSHDILLCSVFTDIILKQNKRWLVEQPKVKV